MVIPKKIIEFNGHIANFERLVPVFDGQALDRKSIARLCMSLLRDVGYPDDFEHEMPPILYHYEQLKLHEAQQCLYVVCDYLKDRPFVPWDSNIIYRGTYFIDKTSSPYKQCYNVKLVHHVSEHVECSSLATIDNIVHVVNEYLSYNIPNSYIIIN